MKKFRKLLFFAAITALLTCLLCMALSAETTNGTCGDRLTWDYYSATGTLYISGTGEMYNYSSSSVPWSHLRGSIKAINISSGVTTIGKSAFV